MFRKPVPVRAEHLSRRTRRERRTRRVTLAPCAEFGAPPARGTRMQLYSAPSVINAPPEESRTRVIRPTLASHPENTLIHSFKIDAPGALARTSARRHGVFEMPDQRPPAADAFLKAIWTSLRGDIALPRLVRFAGAGDLPSAF